MDASKNVRLIDELGRIVLPAEARVVMDWPEKTPVEIWVNAAEQALIIKKHTRTCIFCARTQELKAFEKKHICSACQKAISAL